MNAAEANTAFAVIANWRGRSLDDGERAAWKNRLWQWDADKFDVALSLWETSDKAHMRPSLGDLAALMPQDVNAMDREADTTRMLNRWRTERVDNKSFDPRELPAIIAAREALERANGNAASKALDKKRPVQQPQTEGPDKEPHEQS